MRNLLILILFFCCTNLYVCAQNTFTVWQGFSNYWTYNHRLNRLGDFVQQSSENANKSCILTHTAATGLGKDSAYFQSNYAIIKSNEISFFAGKEHFELKGKEGNTSTITKHIEYIPSENLKDKDEYIAILNGFDITAIEDADKLQLLNINIENPVYDKENNVMKFSIIASLNTDCKSLECDWTHDNFNYVMDIHYLIIGGNKNQLLQQEISYNQKINWNKETEIKPSPIQKTIPLNIGFTNGFIAYKSISIQIDHQQHYLGFENFINNVNIQNNTLQYTQHLFYSNWTANMKKSVASGKQAMFAYRSEGWCIQKGSLSFIQLNDVNITYKSRNGSMYWQGKNKSALDNAAMNSIIINY